MSVPPSWFVREIQAGDVGRDVAVVRRKLGLDPDGSFDRTCQELIRGMARKRNLKSEDGNVNEDVATVLGEQSTAGLTPAWFHRPLQLWFEGPDVATLRKLLGVSAGRGVREEDRFDPDAEKAVLQWQSAHGFPLTGRVDEQMARVLGDA